MSEGHIRCFNCPGRHFSTLLEAVKHVMWERGTQQGSRGVHVRCCVQGCSKSVRKLSQHIRKFHKKLCPLSCSDCGAKFVGPRDLANHQRNGCSPRRKQIAHGNKAGRWKEGEGAVFEPSKTVHHATETFFEKVDFSSSSAVNEFITNDLQLDKAIRDEVSRIVDLLYKHLQDNLPQFSINQLVKGGSFGKGTAVKDKADIDLVVFLNNVKTMEEHKRKLPKTKNRLESCLKHSPYKDQITFGKQTAFAVKFRLDLSREFDIDLLPTFTTERPGSAQSRPEESASNEGIHEESSCSAPPDKLPKVSISNDQAGVSEIEEKLYDEMIGCKRKKKRGYYSAHFVSLQVEFVKGQPAIVKDLIRLVKYWRKTCIEDKSAGKTRLPSSYPLELITIHCWEKAGKPNPFDIRVGFKAVLQKLVDNRHINVRWCGYYSEALANKGIKGMTKSDKSPPFVLDPANPTNNVCSASDDEGWKTVADVAKMTLERQPLRDVIVTRNWQI